METERVRDLYCEERVLIPSGEERGTRKKETAQRRELFYFLFEVLIIMSIQPSNV